MTRCLVFAEVQGGKLHQGVAHAITAAQTLGEVDVVLFAAQPLVLPFQGPRKVYQVIDAKLVQPSVDALIPTLGACAEGYTHFVAAHTSFSRSVMARLAARLRAPMFSDVVSLTPQEVTRPCYAGAVQEVLQVQASRVVYTVRAACFAAAEVTNTPAEVEQLPFILPAFASQVVHVETSASSRPELTTAKVVVSGGRGLGSKENFQLVEQLADQLGAAVGASRAAVDAGFIANDAQVGQTGKTVAPQLYIALGISGAVQHLAGIKGAKTIVAINKDPNAPIFKMADYGLVGDVFTLVPELLSQLKNTKGE